MGYTMRRSIKREQEYNLTFVFLLILGFPLMSLGSDRAPYNLATD